jgi:adhesin transport system membrane fusion protein
MLVVPGQAVQKGQLLARLDTSQYSADLGESQHQRLGALAGRARVEALLSGKEPHFDAEWRRAAPDLIEKETQLWRDTLREYRANGQALQEAVLRKRSELTEAGARIQALQAAVRVGEESFAIEERLFKEGAGARADYLAAQQRLLTQKGELDGLQQSLPRLAAGLAETEATAIETDAKARSQWGAQRTEFETRAAQLSSTLSGRQDRVARRELFSPMDGVVNRVLVPTAGGVVPPGKAIVEVVPNEAALLMNVRIRPSDIGFIRTGQQAHVRVQAYDASTYGKMEASVARVGADAVVDERGEAYFEVQLSAARDQLLLHGQPLPITPGMSLDVGILTGRRSVMQYMLKPVYRGLQGALQER